MLAPVVVFAYNRPDHLRRTIDALAKNDLAQDSVLYIYCDGPKANVTEEQKKRIVDNRMVAHNVSGFKEVHVIEREYNIGLKDNIVGAVTEIVNQYGRIITLEDDVVASVGFLKYMNDALDVYADEERVMHISGYMWPHRWPLPETFFYEIPYPGGGWATWARAWKLYSDDTKELYDYWCGRWDDFNVIGTHLQQQLEANYIGTLKTWFIKWHSALLQNDGLSLYPGKSLTNNIGFDEFATNCNVTDKFDIIHPAKYIRVKRRPIRESKIGAMEIYAFYQGRWYNKRRRNKMFNKIKAIFAKHE